MKLKKLLIVMAGLIFAVILTAVPVLAQSPAVVSAELDRTTITTDDTAILTILIDESYGRASPPQLPVLDGFQVLGSSSGTQMSFINGNMTVKATYSYRLQPVQLGSYIIDPVVVIVNGQSYLSEPLKIEVIQGNGQHTSPQQGSPFGSLFPSMPGFSNFNFPSLPNFPSLQNLAPVPGVSPSGQITPMNPAEAPEDLAGQPYYLESRVSNATPYQGEQIVHILRLYQPTDSFYQPEYTPPSFRGFWSQSDENQRNLSLEYSGRYYQVSEIRTVLVPTVVGQVIIDPASIDIPGGFFNAGRNLLSQPIAVEVLPLPGGSPGSFSGAVGQFEMTANADVRETKVNDAVTMSLILSGTGNLETMGDPIWPDLPGWRAFDKQVTTETFIEDGNLKGQRHYQQVFVPTEAGFQEFQPVEFSYFDPSTGDYVTIRSEPIPISVAADDQSNLPATTLPAADSSTMNSIGLDGLRPLKTAPEKWSTMENTIIHKSGYWILWAVPLLLIATHAGWRYRKNHKLENVDQYRSRQAQKQAVKSLRAVNVSDENAAEPVGPILITYLESKLGISLTGMTNQTVATLLTEKGADDQLIERLFNVFLLSEMGRFAPAELAGPSGNILKEAEQIIKVCEKVL